MKFRKIIDLLVLSLIYILFLYPRWKKKSGKFLVIDSLIYFYIVGVMAFTILPLQPEKVVLASRNKFYYETINLDPFIDLKLNRSRAVLEIILNFIMTLPLGFLIGIRNLLKSRKWSFLRIVFLGLAFTLAIEFIQLYGVYIGKDNIRIFDITDIIVNFFGALFGYGIFLLFKIGFLGVKKRNKE